MNKHKKNYTERSAPDISMISYSLLNNNILWTIDEEYKNINFNKSGYKENNSDHLPILTEIEFENKKINKINKNKIWKITKKTNWQPFKDEIEIELKPILLNEMEKYDKIELTLDNNQRIDNIEKINNIFIKNIMKIAKENIGYCSPRTVTKSFWNNNLNKLISGQKCYYSF